LWARIDHRMPKTEISDVGHTFAGNEVIHRRTYEKLLNLLNLGDEFDKVLEVECMKGRSKYLTKYLSGITSRSDKEFTKSLILFTLLVENASLFTQFLIVASFNKYKKQILFIFYILKIKNCLPILVFNSFIVKIYFKILAVLSPCSNRFRCKGMSLIASIDWLWYFLKLPSTTVALLVAAFNLERRPINLLKSCVSIIYRINR